MKFILIAVLAHSFMGEFDNKTACQNAIRDIYLSQLSLATITPQIKAGIDLQIKYQNKYICVSKQ